MADKWDKYERTTPIPNDNWEKYARRPAPRRVGGERVLDYATETLSNIPGSAGRLASNIGTAISHPLDTAETIGKVAVGTLQNMTPGYVTKDRPGFSAEANAVGEELGRRYGSPRAIADTIRTDPVGVASDLSAVTGGVSTLARGAAMVPRIVGPATATARAAGVISDITNPINIITKPVGAALKATAKPVVKSALNLPGKTERYGATPATAALEETSGLTPKSVAESASKRLGEITTELEALARQSGNTADLTAARDVIAREIAKVQSANGLIDDLLPMQRQLTEARPGFAGATVSPPFGAPPIAKDLIDAQQYPLDFLRMKRQFGDDFTKFDAAIPLRNSARQVGNKAYHELAAEFDRAVPGAAELNQRSQSLIPVTDAARRANERAGPIERAVDRGTRPTGGLAATLFGLHAGGPAGAMAALSLQEALASPTVKMAIARGLYGTGKGISSPLTARSINALGVGGEVANYAPRPPDTPVMPPPFPPRIRQ